jgi:tetratricopeptide (TPR) repeat protein
MRISKLKNRLLGPWPACILIVLTVVIIYGNIYDHQFVFDDVGRIKNNLVIRELQNFFSFDRLFKPRAVVDFTFALNYRFGELDAFGYHLVNMVIHILNGVLVYFLALIIFKHAYFFLQHSQTHSPGPSSISFMALTTSLIFVAHPIQTQAITYTVQRYASMAAFFYLASLLFYLKARLGKEDLARKTHIKGSKSEVIVFYVLSAVCGMAAFLSKANSASLPGIILLMEYLLVDRTWKGWKKKIPWFVLVFFLWVFFVFIVLLVHKETAQIGVLFEDVSALIEETERATRWQYLCTQFNVIVIYIRLLFLPIQQNLDYAYAFKKGFFDGYTPLAFLFLTVIVALGIKAVKRYPVIALGIFWFFITLSVESSIIPIRDALFEPRLYLPMFGFSLIVGAFIFSIFPVRQSWAVVLSFIIVISLGTATFKRNRVWHDGITLWSDVVSKNPQNWRGRTNLGLAMQNEGWLEMAIEQYSKALRLNPDYQFAHHNMANALQDLGYIEKAIAHYLEALRINPDYAFAHHNLGFALEKQGQLDKAVEQYLEALRINPGYIAAHYNLGNALLKQGQIDQAIRHYNDVLRLNPVHADAHNNLGVSLVRKGDIRGAIDHFRAALRINPDYPGVRNNLDQLLKIQ